jgi:hypothetical protein
MVLGSEEGTMAQPSVRGADRCDKYSHSATSNRTLHRFPLVARNRYDKYNHSAYWEALKGPASMVGTDCGGPRQRQDVRSSKSKACVMRIAYYALLDSAFSGPVVRKCCDHYRLRRRQVRWESFSREKFSTFGLRYTFGHRPSLGSMSQAKCRQELLSSSALVRALVGADC